MRKAILGMMMQMLLIGMLLLILFNIPFKAEAKTIIVPDDYSTIQAAINAANPGDTIYVKSGLYFENIIVNKTVTLKGENRDTTIIDGMQRTVVVSIDDASGVIFNGFTVQNGSNPSLPSMQHVGIGVRKCSNVKIQNNVVKGNDEGIWLLGSSNCIVDGNFIFNNKCPGIRITSKAFNNIISNNTIINNFHGICLLQTSHNKLLRNTISENTQWGISLYDLATFNEIVENIISDNQYGIFVPSSSSNNTISGNTITNNWYGISLYNSTNNKFYHNNFINNTLQVYDSSWDNPSLPSSINIWDDGYPSGGNYWSDYSEADLFSGPYQNKTGSDGIGDTPYIVDANKTDHYPLMKPFNTFEAGVWNETAYNINIVSNSTISNFKFDVDQKSVCFNVNGTDGTVGFCRVTIPKSLLWADNGWTIFVDDQPVTDYTRFQDENFTYLYFTYNHSTHTVIIQGTNVIPELPSTLTLIMFTLTTLIATTFWKTKRKHQPP